MTTPLTVTKALFTELVSALDLLFPGQEGHATLIDEMLDAEALDADELQKGRDHALDLAVMGTRPALTHEALVGNLLFSGLTATLGFIVQARQMDR
jgi:hypothetical protein